jgi:hypothetical protein
LLSSLKSQKCTCFGTCGVNTTVSPIFLILFPLQYTTPSEKREAGPGGVRTSDRAGGAWSAGRCGEMMMAPRHLRGRRAVQAQAGSGRFSPSLEIRLRHAARRTPQLPACVRDCACSCMHACCLEPWTACLRVCAGLRLGCVRLLSPTAPWL